MTSKLGKLKGARLLLWDPCAIKEENCSLNTVN